MPMFAEGVEQMGCEVVHLPGTESLPQLTAWKRVTRRRDSIEMGTQEEPPVHDAHKQSGFIK